MRARIPTAAAAVAVLAVTLVVVACGSGRRSSTEITLLPAAQAGGRVWRWTARCPFTPVNAGGCSAAGPVLGHAQLSADAWNLGGDPGDGSLDMSLGSGGAVNILGRFAHTPPCTESTCLASSAYTWVRAYPSVLYGINQCNADTSPPHSSELPLPVALDSLHRSLIGVTAYATRSADVTYDVGYDLWLHQSDTRRPCRTQGTLEILVLTDYDARALLPSSLVVWSARIPSTTGRDRRPESEPWLVYASNISRNGRTAPWGGTLWFTPAEADVVKSGRVSVNLSAVFAVAARLLRQEYGWRDIQQNYWLDTVAFGLEFGPSSGDPLDSAPSHFSANISSLCLDPGSSVGSASCG